MTKIVFRFVVYITEKTRGMHVPYICILVDIRGTGSKSRRSSRW